LKEGETYFDELEFSVTGRMQYILMKKIWHTQLEVTQHVGKTGILHVKNTVYFYSIIKKLWGCLFPPTFLN